MTIKGLLLKVGERLIYFVIGVVSLIVGAVLIYSEFKDHSGGTNHRNSWNSYPFIIFLVGIAGIVMTFARDEKKKAKDGMPAPPDKKTDPGQKTGP